MQRIDSSFTPPISKKTVRFDPEIQKKQAIKDVLKMLQCVQGFFSRDPKSANEILTVATQKVVSDFSEGSYEFNKLMAKCLTSKAILNLENLDLKCTLVQEAYRLDPTSDNNWVYSISQFI